MRVGAEGEVMTVVVGGGGGWGRGGGGLWGEAVWVHMCMRTCMCACGINGYFEIREVPYMKFNARQMHHVHVH